MLPRHSNELLSHLERIADVGGVEIRQGTLLIWYGQERMTVGIWRDIQQKWEEILESVGEKNIPLLVGEATGVWLFVWGEGVSLSDSAWLKDVGALSKRKTEVEAA